VLHKVHAPDAARAGINLVINQLDLLAFYVTEAPRSVNPATICRPRMAAAAEAALLITKATISAFRCAKIMQPKREELRHLIHPSAFNMR
jgi:hypothetical protein